MLKNHYLRRTCRQCNSSDLTLAIKLKETPPANEFVNKIKLDENQCSYPLNVYFCNECKHLQLLDVLDPDYLYKNYLYVSGTSKVFINHFQEYFKSVKNNYFKKGLIIDIGSNDGTLLNFFQQPLYTFNSLILTN